MYFCGCAAAQERSCSCAKARATALNFAKSASMSLPSNSICCDSLIKSNVSKYVVLIFVLSSKIKDK
jgi:hypothetical protein